MIIAPAFSDPLPETLSRRKLLILLGGVAAAALLLPREGRAATPKASGALRLIMVEQKGCPGCAAFLREIAPHYAEAAPDIPLTRVDIHAGNWPEGIVIGARPNATPTFLVLRDGIEIDRIFGYAGETRFWQALRAATA